MVHGGEYEAATSTKKKMAEVFHTIYTLEDLPDIGNRYGADCHVDEDDPSSKPARKEARPPTEDDACILELLVSESEKKLLADFVLSVVEPYIHVTVPASAFDDCAVRCFQILRKKAKHILVHTFDAVSAVNEQWLVQPLEIWRGSELQLGQELLTPIHW